jgi:GntR family transcriptional repressor for pyruvate dehydrogenase complex
MEEEKASKVDWPAFAPRAIRLSESVAAQIEELIVSGQIRAGEYLPSERQLAESLHVSRGLVREAILELTLKGLVSRRQGRGTIVRAPYRSEFTRAIVSHLGDEEREVIELLDFREGLEPPIAARAAERALATDIERLREIAASLDGESDPIRASDLDADFHHAIALATRNAVLIKLVETSMEVMNRSRRRALQSPERRRRSTTAHRAILDAIERGDAVAAEEAMTHHIHGVADAVMQTSGWSRRSRWFDTSSSDPMDR